MPVVLEKSMTDIKKIKAHWEQERKTGRFKGYNSGDNQSSFYSIGKDGEYELRILAMLPYQTGSHWNVLEGRDGKKGAPVKCPRLFDNSECPICEYVEDLASSGDERKEDEASKMKARPRHPMIVVDMDQAREEGVATPKIYEAPVSVYFKILENSTSTRFDMSDFMDMDKGRSVVVKRAKNKNGFTEYSIMFSPNSEPLEYELKEIPEYEKLLKPRSAEDILQALETGEMPAKQEEKEEEKTKPKRYDRGLPATKTREEKRTLRKPLRQEVEEIEDEEDEEIIPEVYEKPIEDKKASPRRSGFSDDLKKKLAAIKKKNS